MAGMSTKNLLIVDRQQVRNSFGKSKKDVKEYIETIKRWFKSQPHLPETPSDELIESFLVTNKFSVELTKEKLDLYYTIRTILPECYESKNPSLPHMKKTAEIIYFCPLPKLTRELYRVNITKITGDPEVFNTYNFFGYQMNINEIRLHEDVNLGDILVVDLSDIKGGHAVKFTPIHMRKAAIILEKVFSNRIKGIHIINAPPYVDTIVNIVKSLLKQKVVDRLHVHKTPEDLQNYIAPEILPKEYGGKEMSLKQLHELWNEKLHEYKPRFDELDELKVKESLRPRRLQNDDILGYHGNFKKLDVD